MSEPLDAAVDVMQARSSWSGYWIAAGLAGLAATQLVAEDRPGNRRSRKRRESSGTGIPFTPVESPPELDVSSVDFNKVCEALLMGSPG